jgi:hypothetical protein
MAWVKKRRRASPQIRPNRPRAYFFLVALGLFGNEVRAIAGERQAVASGIVRSKVSWGKVVRCGSASGPERRRARRGGVIWEP